MRKSCIEKILFGEILFGEWNASIRKEREPLEVVTPAGSAEAIDINNNDSNIDFMGAH